MRRKPSLEELIGAAVWVLAIEIHNAKEDIMSELDDAVARVTADITKALDVLKQAITDAGNVGADVTALNAAADAIEAALPPAPPTP